MCMCMCADPPDAVDDEGDAMLGGEGRFAKSASASTAAAAAAAGRWIMKQVGRPAGVGNLKWGDDNDNIKGYAVSLQAE